MERSHSAELFSSNSVPSPSDDSPTTLFPTLSPLPSPTLSPPLSPTLSPTPTHKKVSSRKSSREHVWGRKGSEGTEKKKEEKRKGSGEVKGWMLDKIHSERKRSSSDSGPSREHQLFDSVKDKNSDVTELRHILREGGVDLNWRNSQKSRFTVLHQACFLGNHQAVRALLERSEIEVNRQCNSEWTPFWLACYKGHVEVVKELLKDPRVDVNLPDHIGASPLWWAACNGYIEVIQWMFASGRSFETSTMEDRGQWKLNGLNPLEIAQRQDKKEIVELIKRYIANPHTLRAELREQLGIQDSRNAELFAVVIFLSDDYLSFKGNSDLTHPQIHRFFNILKRLPLELQMVFCNRMFGSAQDSIPPQDAEEAFYRVSLAFRRDQRLKLKRSDSDRGSCLTM